MGFSKSIERDMYAMKKTFLKIVSFFVLISLIPSFCYASSADYSSSFDTLLGMMTAIAGTDNGIAQINIALWEEVGPSDVMRYIQHVLYIGQYGDKEYQGTYTLKRIKKVLGEYDYLALTQTYYNATDSLPRYLEATKVMIKMDRDKYPDHAAAFKALQDYYVKLAAYTDFAINPSGNLIDYRTNYQQYQKELQELKFNAEFEK